MEITLEGIVAIIALIVFVIVSFFTNVIQPYAIIFIVAIIFLFALLISFAHLNNRINKLEDALKRKRKGQIDPRLIIILLILLFLYLYLRSIGRI